MENERKLRIMVNSNAMWSPSGYAQQARQFVPMMARAGFATGIINFYGQEGGIFKLDGVYQYPRIDSVWGDDAMVFHSKHFNPDVIFTLQDIWVLNMQVLQQLVNEGRRWIPIVPIDHEPVPPAIFDRLKLAYRIVTYAPFGYNELKRNGMHSTYIPHTVQGNVYKKRDKVESRNKFGLPQDKFIFGMVAANKDNPPRKGFQHAIDAFAKFHKEHPDSAMYFHTKPQQQGGFPIDIYAKSLGLYTGKDIFFVDSYAHMFTLTPEDMSYAYSAMDTYLMPSQNEGFGVPLIEAQACEVPVIATDFTAMKDLIIDGETGWKLKVERKYYSPLLSYVAIPDATHLHELMEKAYVADREKMGKKGREFVMKNYELSTVWENNWMPFLNNLEKEIYE